MDVIPFKPCLAEKKDRYLKAKVNETLIYGKRRQAYIFLRRNQKWKIIGITWNMGLILERNNVVIDISTEQLKKYFEEVVV